MRHVTSTAAPVTAAAPRPAPTVNVLAGRYASPEMMAIWSPENKIIAERRLWLAVLRAQSGLGLTVDPQVISDYEVVIDQQPTHA